MKGRKELIEMREAAAAAITKAVKDLFIDANLNLGEEAGNIGLELDAA